MSNHQADWGLGYRIVTRKLGAFSACESMEPAIVDNIVDKLFPTHPVRPSDEAEALEEETPLFITEELVTAVKGLQNRKTPGQWKTQRLVLISKGKGDPNTPGAYRPLCMLNTTGKLLQKLLKPRLETAIKESGDLSPRQYGSRKGRSIVQAVHEIVETVHSVQSGSRQSRPIVLLATLDVKNAFNSARWIDMIEALKKFKSDTYCD